LQTNFPFAALIGPTVIVGGFLSLWVGLLSAKVPTLAKRSADTRAELIAQANADLERARAKQAARARAAQPAPTTPPAPSAPNAAPTPAPNVIDCATEPQLEHQFNEAEGAAIDHTSSIMESKPGTSPVSLAAIENDIERMKTVYRALVPAAKAGLPSHPDHADVTLLGR
jgi:hypothetical protein